ncbi:MAG: pyridoxal-phosphate dependent enzyme [Ginsengibacter sp.]
MSQSMIKELLPDIHFREPPITVLENNLYQKKGVEVSMLRLDEIHPVISGNKLFKLFYFLQEAKMSARRKMITFGGAYSNHLAATAFVCKEANLPCVGIVRGERPDTLSHTLLFCMEQGMKLEFISRTAYQRIEEKDFLQELKNKYGEHILVPEGGFSVKGKKGAAMITSFFKNQEFTHICLPVGTATTFAGIIEGSNSETLGLGVLKNLHDIDVRLRQLQIDGEKKKYVFNGDYHFGGYAKKTEELISFINQFYRQHTVPLDFVYTGKMMYGINDLVQKKYFPPGSRILCIHTGGLQGNESLPKGMLHF